MALDHKLGKQGLDFANKTSFWFTHLHVSVGDPWHGIGWGKKNKKTGTNTHVHWGKHNISKVFPPHVNLFN